ncbi:hypothetical protein NPIL_60991 [Nephila pilipes]|uniref:Uncharacterized protein n=1 Tax=Nephila pilipes TaxID=299642 RepID=A0A8X6NQB9_NEPPI|nr:hypothetical protein NPIL_60991 [Nephila pilipes]
MEERRSGQVNPPGEEVAASSACVQGHHTQSPFARSSTCRRSCCECENVKNLRENQAEKKYYSFHCDIYLEFSSCHLIGCCGMTSACFCSIFLENRPVLGKSECVDENVCSECVVSLKGPSAQYPTKQNNRRPKPDAPMISSSANDRSRPTLLWGCLGGRVERGRGARRRRNREGVDRAREKLFSVVSFLQSADEKEEGKEEKNRLNESRAKEGAGREKKSSKGERVEKKEARSPVAIDTVLYLVSFKERIIF